MTDIKDLSNKVNKKIKLELSPEQLLDNEIENIITDFSLDNKIEYLNNDFTKKLLKHVIKSIKNDAFYQRSQLIFYGPPSSQKSTFFKLVAYADAILSKINTRVFWLNLDTLTKDNIFGGNEFGGILKEIFLQTHAVGNKTSA